MSVIELLTPPAPAKRPRRTLTATETALRDIGRQFGRKGEGDRNIALYVERDGEHAGAAIATDTYALAVFPAGSSAALAIAATLDTDEVPAGQGRFYSLRKNPHPASGVIVALSATRPGTITGAGLWNLFPAGPLETIERWADVTDILPSADREPADRILAGITAAGDTGVIVSTLVLTGAGAKRPGVSSSILTAGERCVDREHRLGWARRPITLSVDGAPIGLAMPLRPPNAEETDAILARLKQ